MIALARNDALPVWSLSDSSITEADATFRKYLISGECEQSQVMRRFPRLDADWFSPATALIYKAVGGLLLRNELVSIISITEEMRNTETLAAAGGPAAIGIPEAYLPWPVVEQALETLEIAYQRKEARGLIEQALHRVDHSPLDALAQTRAALDEIAFPSVLPMITDAAALLAEPAELPEELITGLLHRGGKLVLGGGSKTFKTWTLVDAAISVATGTPFWNFDCRKGRVLFVNFEIQSPFFTRRIAEVSAAKGLKLGNGQLDVLNLRGHAADADLLLPKIYRMAGREHFALIILDPLYKLLGGRDENASRDMASLMNGIERLAVDTGAAVAFGSHFAKGNASGKESMDRISGSGVFARDPDSILTMTRHEAEDAFAIEMTLRNHPPQEPFVVRRQHPLMVVDRELDPRRLKGLGGRKEETRSEDLLEILGNNCLTFTELRDRAMKQLFISPASFKRKLQKLKTAGRIRQAPFDQEKYVRS